MLAAPRLPARLVRRPRLFDRLNVGVRGPVTLVAAQAGAGKTVLLSSWLAAGDLPGPVAWLTLEPADGEPGRFWARVLAALRSTGAVPSEVLETLQPQLPSIDGAFPQLLATELGRLRSPVVLILDDFHVVNTPAVLGAVQVLLQVTPPQLRLVIATRVDPTLPHLPRLRLNGELVELRTADLAFTAAEAAELLDGHGVTLSETDLALLQARTEGWAAGVRLAALWLEDRSDTTWAVAAFAGTDRTVADYLVAEIVDRQPPHVRDFLLSTCIVDQISSELANALTGRQDGEQMLVALERAHAFITAVGPDRSWYRYHPLFAELLRFELRRRTHEEVARLHQRAAHWHAEHKAPIAALRHALAARDWAYSVDLLMRYGLGLALQGEVGVIREVTERLPPEVGRETPELDVLMAFHRFESLDHEVDWQHIEMARRRVPGLPEHRRDRYRLLVALLELVAARRTGDLERVLTAGREVLTLQVATATQTARVADDDAIRAAALLNVGAAELWTGTLDAAEGHLREGAHTAEHAGLARLQLESLSLLAQLHVACGRLGVAHVAGRRATDLAEAHGWSQDHRAGGGHLALASVALERSDLDAAGRHIGAALTSCAAAPWRPVRLGVAIVHAWLCQARGDTVAGFAVLDTAREQVASWIPRPPTWLTDWVTVTDAELRTVAGDIDAAQALLVGLRDHDTDHGSVSAPMAVAMARLQLADGDAAGAVQTLAPWLDGSAAAGSPRPLIAAWMLNAAAARQLGDSSASLSLEHALALAEPEGFRQVFADGGLPVRAVLTAHLATATSHRSFLGDLLNHTATRTTIAARPELVEPLSARERDVLRYLPSRLSSSEIAAELYLSVHTVKSHMRNLYRKLQAANRREAVEHARELKLL